MSRLLAGTLVETLVRCGLKIAGAESCTGGLVATAITAVPGSSRVFNGAVVAYANEAKRHILGVSEETLARYGAVSEESALDMARGSRRLFQVPIAYAITGIAGPEGGSEEKPVGTVWAALSHQADEAVLWRLQGTRSAVRTESLQRMLCWLLGIAERYQY